MTVHVFDTVVQVKPSLISLGVTLDSCLTWSSHIDTVVGKCIGMLIRVVHFAKVSRIFRAGSEFLSIP